MSDNMLSQDEISALLSESDSDVEGADSIEDIDITDYLTSMEVDAIGEIGNISFGNASTAFSALLNQKVEITTPRVIGVLKKDLSQKFPHPHIIVNVNYTEGFFGTNLFVIDANDAKIISDLMFGGDGKDIPERELSEMDLSALQEAMNQMMGSAATSMSTIFNTSVNISTPSIDNESIASGEHIKHLTDDDVILMVSFKMQIGDLIDSNFVQIISISFAKEMVRTLIGSAKEGNIENEIKNDVAASSVAAHNQPSSNQMSEMAATNSNNYTSSSNKQVYNNNNYPGNNTLNNNINPNVDVHSAQFSELDSNKNIVNDNDTNLGLLMDIPLQISVELGRTNKLIKEILELSSGSIVELDKLAGEPVDIYANRKLIAKGEVVVIDENFGVRITDIISQIDRVKKLQ